MSEVIIKLKFSNPINGIIYDILYKDYFIAIEGFCSNDNRSYYFVAGNLSLSLHKTNIKTANKAIKKAIKELKKIKPIDQYIPTIMRLTALKETL